MNIGAPIDGCEGYSFARDLPTTGIRRRWTLHGQPRSIEWRNGGIVKTREPFVDHPTVEAMRDLLAECAARNVERPSSYGDLFHQRHYQPPLRAAHRKLFPPGTIPGGWNGVRERNARVVEPLYRYDIRSAYLWALMQGLPDPATFRTVRRVTGPGLYWCESQAHPLLPHPWNKAGIFPATEDELLALPLAVRSVRYGIAFEPGSWGAVPEWVADIRAWSCWKAVGKTFWGRWIAGSAAVAETFDAAGDLRTARDLPDLCRNPVWAALITSRLRLRLWQMVDTSPRPVLRVYTDSVVTAQQLTIGENIGDWQLEAEYPKGAIITSRGVTPLT